MACLAHMLHIGGIIIGGSAALERFYGRELAQPSAFGIAAKAFIQVPGLETVGKAIQSVSAFATSWREQPTRLPPGILPFVRRQRVTVAKAEHLEEQLARLRETRVSVAPPDTIWRPGVLIHEEVPWLNATIQRLEVTGDGGPEVTRVRGLIDDLLRRLEGQTARYHKSLLWYALYERLEGRLAAEIAEQLETQRRRAAYADVYSEGVFFRAFAAEGVRRGLSSGVGSAEFGAMLDDMRKFSLEIPPSRTAEALTAFFSWLLGRRGLATIADVEQRQKELGELGHVRLAAAVAVFLRVLLSYSAIGSVLQWLVGVPDADSTEQASPKREVIMITLPAQERLPGPQPLLLESQQ